MDRKWWTLLAVCFGTFMLLLDVTIVIVALPEHPVGPARQFRRRAVGGRRLRADPGVAAPDGGRARRPLRPPAPVRDRPGRVHGWLAVLRAGAVAAHADPLPQRPGRSAAPSCSPPRWRSWDRASGEGTAAWPSASGARSPAWRCRSGPILGGRHHHRHQLAGHLPRQRAGRRGGPRSSRPTASTSHAPHARAGRTGPASSLLTAGLVGLIYGLIRASEISWSDTAVIACPCRSARRCSSGSCSPSAGQPTHVRPVAVPHPHLRRRACSPRSR